MLDRLVDTSAQIVASIERMQAGDASARHELIKAACERLLRLTRKMLSGYPGVKRWEQTDDVFQNAMMRLERALHEVTPPSVGAFLRLAALQIRRELLDLARHYHGPRGLGAAHASVGAGSNESTPVVQQGIDTTNEPSELARWTEFHRLVETLPDDERAAFDLVWYEELTLADAAAVLGISESTAKRRWRSARVRLHEALGGEVPGA